MKPIYKDIYLYLYKLNCIWILTFRWFGFLSSNQKIHKHLNYKIQLQFSVIIFFLNLDCHVITELYLHEHQIIQSFLLHSTAGLQMNFMWISTSEFQLNFLVDFYSHFIRIIFQVFIGPKRICYAHFLNLIRIMKWGMRKF